MSNGAGDDPFRPRDATVLRPRPGAGKRGAAPGPYMPPPAAATRQPDPEPLNPNALENVGLGLNPLARAASALLLIAGRVRGSLQGDVAALRRETQEEIRRFEEKARAAGVASEVILAARYVLCATVDEAVLTTPWGAQSEWAQQTLLIAYHREAWGGEKFFEMIERIQDDPARHIDLMELQYLCLCMGFAGKYQVVDRGHARLADIQQDLYRRIRQFRGQAPTDLSLRWRGVTDQRNPVVRYVPWWVVGAASLLILTIAFVFYHVRLGRDAAPVQAALARIGLADFTAPAAAAPMTGPTLKELLAPNEARGEITVEEQGGRTLITLTAPKLFASGSARVNPSYYPTLESIANAIDQVPGRVLVVGHTDDQPLASVRFRDNLELSRERAVSVVDVMKLAIDEPGRLEFTGVGSSEPRHRPESDPENRARNRRVEIVHVAGAAS